MTRGLRWGYLIGIHAVLLVLIWKTDFIERVQFRLGLWRPPEIGRGWSDMVAIQRRIDAQLPPGAVLFIGDSLTAGLDVGRFGRRAANFGIGFDTTAGVLARLSAYRSIATASAVVLLVGVNDQLYRDAAAVAANHQRILRQLGPTRVVAVGLLPVDERATIRASRASNAWLRGVNQALAGACAAQPNCRYVDAWPLLTEGGDGLKPANHVGDGLHLNAAGYERLAAAIAPALAP